MSSRDLGKFVDHIGSAMFISLNIFSYQFIEISVKSHIGATLVLVSTVSTHRYTNRDTPSKAHWRLHLSKAVWAQPTDQLSVCLQGCHKTTLDLQHYHILHICSHTYPPHTSLGSHSFIPTPSYLTADEASSHNDHMYSYTSTQYCTINHTNH